MASPQRDVIANRQALRRAGVTYYSPTRRLRPPGGLANAGTAQQIMGGGAPTPVPGQMPTFGAAMPPAQGSQLPGYQPPGGGPGGYESLEQINARLSTAIGTEPQGGGFLGSVVNAIPTGVTNMLGSAMDVFSYPRRAVQSSLQELVIDPLRGEEGGLEEWGAQIADPEYGFGSIFPSPTGHKWVDRFIGLGGDILLDPITYAGASGLRAGSLGYAARTGLAAEGVAAKLPQRIVDKLGRFGISRSSAAERQLIREAGVGAGRHILDPGYYFKVPTRDRFLRIPLSGVPDRAFSHVASGARNLIAQTPARQWMSFARSPIGQRVAMSKLAGYGGTQAKNMSFSEAAEIVNFNNGYKLAAKAASNRARGIARGAIHEARDSFASGTRGINALVRGAETGEDNIVSRYFKNMFRMYSNEYGVPINELPNYFPHYLTEGGKAFFKGEDPVAREWVKKILKSVDLDDDSPVLLRRQIVPRDEPYNIGGHEFHIKEGSVHELNEVLRRVTGQNIDFYDADFSSVATRYAKSIEEAVGRVGGLKRVLSSKSQLARRLNDPSLAHLLSAEDIDLLVNRPVAKDLKNQWKAAVRQVRQVRDDTLKQITDIKGTLGEDLREIIGDLTSLPEDTRRLLDEKFVAHQQEQAKREAAPQTTKPGPPGSGKAVKTGASAPPPGASPVEVALKDELDNLSARHAELDKQIGEATPIVTQAAQDWKRKVEAAEKAWQREYGSGAGSQLPTDQIPPRPSESMQPPPALAKIFDDYLELNADAGAVAMDAKAIDSLLERLEINRDLEGYIDTRLADGSFLNLAVADTENPIPRFPDPAPGEVRRTIPEYFNTKTGLFEPERVQRLTGVEVTVTHSPVEVMQEAQRARAAVLGETIDMIQIEARMRHARMRLDADRNSYFQAKRYHNESITLATTKVKQYRDYEAGLKFHYVQTRGHPEKLDEHLAIERRLTELRDKDIPEVLEQLRIAEEPVTAAKATYDNAKDTIQQIRDEQLELARQLDAANVANAASDLLADLPRPPAKSVDREIRAQIKQLQAERAAVLADEGGIPGETIAARGRRRTLADQEVARIDRELDVLGPRVTLKTGPDARFRIDENGNVVSRGGVARLEQSRFDKALKRRNATRARYRAELAEWERQNIENITPRTVTDEGVTVARAEAEAAQDAVDKANNDLLSALQRGEELPGLRQVRDDYAQIQRLNKRKGRLNHYLSRRRVVSTQLDDRIDALERQLVENQAARTTFAEKAQMRGRRRDLVAERGAAEQRYEQAQQTWNDLNAFNNPEDEEQLIALQRVINDEWKNWKGAQQRVLEFDELMTDATVGGMQTASRQWNRPGANRTRENAMVAINRKEMADIKRLEGRTSEFRSVWEDIPVTEQPARDLGNGRWGDLMDDPLLRQAVEAIEHLDERVPDLIDLDPVDEITALLARLRAAQHSFKMPAKGTPLHKALTGYKDPIRGGSMVNTIDRARSISDQALTTLDNHTPTLIGRGAITPEIRDAVASRRNRLEMLLDQYQATPYLYIRRRIEKTSGDLGRATGFMLRYSDVLNTVPSLQPSDSLAAFVLTREIRDEVRAIEAQMKDAVGDMSKWTDDSKALNEWMRAGVQLDQERSTLRAQIELAKEAREAGQPYDKGQMNRQVKRVRQLNQQIARFEVADPRMGAIMEDVDGMVEWAYEEAIRTDTARTAAEHVRDIARSMKDPRAEMPRLEGEIEAMHASVRQMVAGQKRLQDAVARVDAAAEGALFQPTTVTYVPHNAPDSGRMSIEQAEAELAAGLVPPEMRETLRLRISRAEAAWRKNPHTAGRDLSWRTPDAHGRVTISLDQARQNMINNDRMIADVTERLEAKEMRLNVYSGKAQMRANELITMLGDTEAMVAGTPIDPDTIRNHIDEIEMRAFTAGRDKTEEEIELIAINQGRLDRLNDPPPSPEMIEEWHAELQELMTEIDTVEQVVGGDVTYRRMLADGGTSFLKEFMEGTRVGRENDWMFFESLMGPEGGAYAELIGQTVKDVLGNRKTGTREDVLAIREALVQAFGESEMVDGAIAATFARQVDPDESVGRMAVEDEELLRVLPQATEEPEPLDEDLFTGLAGFGEEEIAPAESITFSEGNLGFDEPGGGMAITDEGGELVPDFGEPAAELRFDLDGVRSFLAKSMANSATIQYFDDARTFAEMMRVAGVQFPEGINGFKSFAAWIKLDEKDVRTRLRAFFIEQVIKQGYTPTNSLRDKWSELSFRHGRLKSLQRGLGATLYREDLEDPAMIFRLINGMDTPGLAPEQQMAADAEMFQRAWAPPEVHASYVRRQAQLDEARRAAIARVKAAPKGSPERDAAQAELEQVRRQLDLFKEGRVPPTQGPQLPAEQPVPVAALEGTGIESSAADNAMPPADPALDGPSEQALSAQRSAARRKVRLLQSEIEQLRARPASPPPVGGTNELRAQLDSLVERTAAIEGRPDRVFTQAEIHAVQMHANDLMKAGDRQGMREAADKVQAMIQRQWRNEPPESVDAADELYNAWRQSLSGDTPVAAAEGAAEASEHTSRIANLESQMTEQQQLVDDAERRLEQLKAQGASTVTDPKAQNTSPVEDPLAPMLEQGASPEAPRTLPHRAEDVIPADLQTRYDNTLNELGDILARHPSFEEAPPEIQELLGQLASRARNHVKEMNTYYAEADKTYLSATEPRFVSWLDQLAKERRTRGSITHEWERVLLGEMPMNNILSTMLRRSKLGSIVGGITDTTETSGRMFAPTLAHQISRTEARLEPRTQLAELLGQAKGRTADEQARILAQLEPYGGEQGARTIGTAAGAPPTAAVPPTAAAPAAAAAPEELGDLWDNFAVRGNAPPRDAAAMAAEAQSAQGVAEQAATQQTARQAERDQVATQLAAKQQEYTDALTAAGTTVTAQARNNVAQALDPDPVVGAVWRDHVKKVVGTATKKTGANSETLGSLLEDLRQINNVRGSLLGRDQVDVDAVEAQIVAALESVAILDADTTKSVTNEQLFRQAGINRKKISDITKKLTTDGWTITASKLMTGDDAMVISTGLATGIENVVHGMNRPDFWQWIDKYTAFFKTYATAKPGFHVRNALSATFMNLVAGVRFRSLWTGLTDWRAFERNPEQWWEGADDIQRQAMQVVSGSGAGGQWEEFGVGGATGIGAKGFQRLMNNPLTRLNRRVGTRVEGSARYAMAIDTLRRGASIDEALRRVTKFHFNYEEMSGLDVYAKRFIPFWTFMSRNLPLQIEQMWMNPRTYLHYDAVVRNFGQPLDPMTPEYWLNQGVWTLDENAENRESPWYLAPDLPHLRVLEPLQAAESGDWGKALFSDLNPLGMAPFEAFVGNKKMYTGAPVNEHYREPVGMMANLLPLFKLLGGTKEGGRSGKTLLDDRYAHVARSWLPPLELIERFQDQSGVRAGRQDETFLRLLGFPFYNLTPELRKQTRNSQYYEAQDEAAIRSQVARS